MSHTISAVEPAALGHVRRGCAVFPLRAGRKTPAISKKRGGKGFEDATNDEARVARWFTDQPHLNIGIRTGTVSGLVVLDVDGEQGRASLRALECVHGRLPWTYTVETPSGGVHFYFQAPDVPVPRSINRDVGLDVLGDGGYGTWRRSEGAYSSV